MTFSHFKLGVASLDDGDLEAAVRHFSILLRSRPAALGAYHSRATAYLRQGKLDEGVSDLDQVIARCDPSEQPVLLADALNLRGVACARQRRFEQAFESFSRLLVLQPAAPYGYLNRANVLVDAKQYRKALDDYNEAIRLAPDLSSGYLGRANVWQRLGANDRALRDYLEAERLDPSLETAAAVQRMLVAAQSHFLSDNYASAIAACSEAIKLDAACPGAFQLRAAAYWYSERWKEALDDFGKILEVTQDDVLRLEVLCGRGQIYAECGEFDKALPELERAISLAQALSQSRALAYALSARGLALAGAGNFRQGIEDFERSVALEPTNAWVYLHRAHAEYQQGQIFEALGHVKASLELSGPPLTPAKRYRANLLLKHLVRVSG